MGVLHGVIAAGIEKLPLVRLTDVSGDDDLELVVGPKPSSSISTVLRVTGGKSVQIGRLVLTLGGE